MTSNPDHPDRPNQLVEIDELCEKMVLPYLDFLQDRGSEARTTLDLEMLDLDSYRYDLLGGLDCVFNLICLIGMASRLPRLQTLTLGELPRARESWKEALVAYARWVDSTKEAEFRLSRRLIEDARLVQMSWQAIGDAIGMTAQGVHKKMTGSPASEVSDSPSPKGD